MCLIGACWIYQFMTVFILCVEELIIALKPIAQFNFCSIGGAHSRALILPLHEDGWCEGAMGLVEVGLVGDDYVFHTLPLLLLYLVAFIIAVII